MAKKQLEYLDAQKYINNLPRTGAGVFMGKAGLVRMREFLLLLGAPQSKLKVIHIAGTSGKGSTAMLTSAFLVASGKVVGLALSPHVYDMRERIQLNNRMVPKSNFAATLSKIIPAICAMQANNKPVTYFEVLLAMAFYYFAKARVDYAVIETGVGGLFDGSNVVNSKDKIAVITRIGLDHTKLLGNSISKIATQKAGIIQDKNHVVALRQSPIINQAIETRAKSKRADIQWVAPAKNSEPAGHIVKENIKIARAIISFLSQRDHINVDDEKLMNAQEQLYLPGRFEVIKTKDKTFILDGAHNPQKISGFIKQAVSEYPNSNLGLILAMKTSKATPKITNIKNVITTSCNQGEQDMPVPAENPNKLRLRILRLTPLLKVQVAADITEAIGIAQGSKIDTWLITGSFFLLGEAKKLLRQQS